MTRMSAPDCGNLRGMARDSQPVVNGGPNPAALDGRLAGPGMAGDEEDDTVAARDRHLESAIDRRPGLVERMPVKVDGAVRLDRSAFQPLVPAAVQCRSGPGLGRRWRRRRPPLYNRRDVNACAWVYWTFRDLRKLLGIAGEGTDGRRDARPQRLFVRAERAHGQPRPWAGAGGPFRWSPYRQRWRWQIRPPPRRYRSGWRP